MFGDEKGDSWQWMPYILIIGAIVFLFWDPLGMKNTEVKYIVTNAPGPTRTPGFLVGDANANQDGAPAAQLVGDAENSVIEGSDYPNALSTGPRTSPTKTWPEVGNGTWINVSQNADGYIFNGCVRTTRKGVRITNSEIRGDCATALLYDEGGAGVFDYNTVIDVGRQGAAALGCGTSSRFFRNNVRGAADGVAEGTNCQVIENYIHDLDEFLIDGSGTHNEGVAIEDPATTGMKITKNTFENTCGKNDLKGQGCAGVVYIANGAAGNTVDGNYIKRWNGPNTGFLFHIVGSGINDIKNNVIECANVTGFGFANGGRSMLSNNTECIK